MLIKAVFSILFGILITVVQGDSCKPACTDDTDTTGIFFPPKVASIFDPFTLSQLESIAEYVRSKLGLLSSVPEDTCFGRYIYSIDWLHDSKTRVLQSLDGNNPYPGRYAKAVVYELASEATAKLVEYKVGPIAAFPLSASVPIVPISWPGNYRNSTFLPATMRPFINEYSLMEPLIAQAFVKLRNLTQVSYGVSDESFFTFTDTSPRGFTSKTRQTWIWFMWNLEGSYALPIGLTMLIDHKPLDPNDWTIIECSYNGQGPFRSIDDLATKFNRGLLDIAYYPKPEGTPAAPLWSSMRRRGTVRALETRPIPKILQEGGPRYAVNGHQVHWLDWDFHIGYELVAGIRFNDIRFRGQRIIYELALQDAYACYGGRSPVQSLSQYNDAGWGMGWSCRTLMPGVDCPASASTIDVDYFVKGAGASIPGAFCIWEQPDNIAIMRHYDGYGDGFNFVAGTPRTALVVRMASQVYNYDYYYNYIFYADGQVKVESLASGYLQSEFNPSSELSKAAEKTFQRPLRKFTSGNVHDHLFGYKVDLDVLGVNNSLMRKVIRAGTFQLPWNFDGKLSRMKYIDEKRVDKEGKDSWYNVDPKEPTTFMFVKENAKNQWGLTRAYGIQLGATITQLIDKAPWMPSNEWTKYNVVVTRQKDSEVHSGYPLYEMQAPSNPIVNFDSYINGESLVNQDLVAWIMIGNSHVPSAEDIPVTTTAHTSLEFYIRPMNYFDESAVTDLTSRIYVTGSEPLPDAVAENVDTVNTPQEDRCFDGTPVPAYNGGF